MVSIALQSVFKSLRTYYGDPTRAGAMDNAYSRFVPPGGLAFDIGSHVGDRIASFRRLGARVVALEPQPLLFRAMRLIHSRNDHVTLINQACGVEPGSLTLHVNDANPTVSTVSSDFIAAADGAEGWEGQQWNRKIEVPVTTLDDLISEHGEPDFIKIDVEGFELDVLRGLSASVQALSFEFTTIQRDVALACIDHLARFDCYSFNGALGEGYEWMFEEDVGPETMSAYINDLPHSANSGDIYARKAV